MKEIVLIAQVNENNRVQLQQFYVVCSKKSIRDKDLDIPGQANLLLDIPYQP